MVPALMSQALNHTTQVPAVKHPVPFRPLM